MAAPGSLGATATIVANVLTINFAGSDPANIEQVSVSGLKIAASATASPGAIVATLGGSQALCVSGGTATASGHLASSTAAGSTGFTIILDPSSCPFQVTGTGTGPAGNLSFTINPETKAITAAGAVVAGVQAVTTAAAANAHFAGEAVSQLLVTNCNPSTLASPGIVANVVIENTVPTAPLTVVPGENNQPAANVTLTETGAGTIPVGTLTFTLSAPGVQFSSSPTVSVNNAGQQTLTVAALANAHVIGESVIQVHAACTSNGVTNAAYSAGVTSIVVNDTAVTAAGCPFTATGGTDLGILISNGAVTQTLGVAALANAHLAGTAVTQAHAECISSGTLAVAVLAAATSVSVTDSAATAASCPFVATAGTDLGIAFAAPGPETVNITSTDNAERKAAAVATAVASTGGLVSGSVCSLSIDRMSCTVSVTTVSTNPSTLTLSNIKLDVAATVALGTKVQAVVTSSGAINVLVTANTIAVVGRVIVGTAAQPTIFIGFNDQQTGLITLTESGAGFFTAGAGPTNTFALCLESGEAFTRAPWAVVTVAGGTAPTSLQLLSGLVGVSQAKGTLFTDGDGESCAYWTIYSASSTGPGTIEIRGSADDATPLASGANNGPRLSVPNGLAPGTTQSEILVGTLFQVQNDGGALSLVSNAIRAFKSGVIVAAVSQPRCAPGSTDCLGGNLTITETLNGQFKAGQLICVAVLPRTSNGVRIQDTVLKTATTNDLPLINTNVASGLLASTVAVAGCPAPFTILPTAGFSFTVNQQSFGPTLGQITISNIHFTITPDAVLGPVQLDVMGSGGGVVTVSTQTATVAPTLFAHAVGEFVSQVHATCTSTATLAGPTAIGATSLSLTGVSAACPFTVTGGTNLSAVVGTGLTTDTVAITAVTVLGSITTTTGVAFESVVSNALIGGPLTQTTIGNSSAIGVTTSGPFTLTTKVVAVNKYVTFRAATNLPAGTHIEVWVATKTGSTWSAFTKLTARVVDSAHNAYFYWRSSTPKWVSVRWSFAGAGSFGVGGSLARQARAQ